MILGNFNPLISLNKTYGTTNANFKRVVFKNLNGVENTLSGVSAPSYNLFQTYAKIVLGNGDTEPTFLDYVIENSIDSSLTTISDGSDIPTTGDSSSSVRYDDFNAFHILSVTKIVRNDTNDAITIKEIGIVSRFTASMDYILFTRDVIDPVIIYPGETKSFMVSVGDPLYIPTSVSVS